VLLLPFVDFLIDLLWFLLGLIRVYHTVNERIADEQFATFLDYLIELLGVASCYQALTREIVDARLSIFLDYLTKPLKVTVIH